MTEPVKLSFSLLLIFFFLVTLIAAFLIGTLVTFVVLAVSEQNSSILEILGNPSSLISGLYVAAFMATPLALILAIPGTVVVILYLRISQNHTPRRLISAGAIYGGGLGFVGGGVLLIRDAIYNLQYFLLGAFPGGVAGCIVGILVGFFITSCGKNADSG